MTYGPDNYRSDQAIWAEPWLVDKNGEKTDLTTIAPTSSQVGWGQLFINHNQKNQPLSIGGREFARGFWAHGPSMLHFKLDSSFVQFQAQVGIDTGAGRNGSAEFIVTDVRPEMPSLEIYGGRAARPKLPPLPISPSAHESPHLFNADAAEVLLRKGIDQLVFIRRYTLNANHVYTEYVNSRWTPGGGLCVLDLNTGKVQKLARELGDGVVNRFDISFDGTRIAFVSTRCQYGILCNAGDVYTTKNLYRMDADGGNMEPLSNSPVSEASPAILPDGRILYHRWEYVDKAAGNVKCLWAMNPDGTATAEVYGNTITFPETMIYARPIPDAPGKIVMLGTSHCCPNNAMGAVIVIDTSDDIRSAESMHFVTDDIRALAHTGFHFRDENGEWQLDKTGKLGRLFKDPYPVSDDLFIASRKPLGPTWDDPKAYDLVLLNDNGEETLLYEDEAISCWHPYPLRSRERPPVVTSSQDPRLAEQDLALCVVTDVYRGMDGVEPGTVKYLRVLEEVPRPWAARKSWSKDDKDGMAHTAIGDDLLGLKAQYGIVPVEEDSSAQFYVPALRNIYFQALDENCLAVQTERTYVHYMPGETRSCIGCHETPNNTPHRPPANTPLALLQRPSVPSPQPGETVAKKLFDYHRQIQPIWDRHCVECHNNERAEGGLNLCGDPEGVYSVSYNQLIKLSKGKKQLLGNRKPRNEDVGSAGVEYLPPYNVGALTSPLAALLSQGKIRMQDPQLQTYVDSLAESHQDVRLSDTELLQVANWLDINCQFHPSYWGRLNAKYKEHPNFRPDVTFDEALLRTVPASIARGERTEEALSAISP